jgi:hypothetical protein
MDQCNSGICLGTQLSNFTIDCGIYGCINNMTNQLINQDPSLCINDNNQCTMDSCQNGTCIYNTTSANGMLCNDNKNCTIGDLCFEGECISGNDLCDECTIRAGTDAFTIGIIILDDFVNNPIVSDFFGPGSDPFDDIIIMSGNGIEFIQPIGTLIDQLADIDTIIERKKDAHLNEPSGSEVIPIEIVSLSLKSVQPIIVTYPSKTEMWNVECNLSENAIQPIGTINITASDCSCNEGGTFIPNLSGFTKLNCKFINITNNSSLNLDNINIELLPNNIIQDYYTQSPNGNNTITLINEEYIIDQYNTGNINKTINNFCGDFYPGVRLDKCEDICISECQNNTQCDDGLNCTTDICLLPSGMCKNSYELPIGQNCYTGPIITQNIGICKDGVYICQEPNGSIICVGEVLPQIIDIPNDGLDSNCDGID